MAQQVHDEPGVDIETELTVKQRPKRTRRTRRTRNGGKNDNLDDAANRNDNGEEEKKDIKQEDDIEKHELNISGYRIFKAGAEGKTIDSGYEAGKQFYGGKNVIFSEGFSSLSKQQKQMYEKVLNVCITNPEQYTAADAAKEKEKDEQKRRKIEANMKKKSYFERDLRKKKKTINYSDKQKRRRSRASDLMILPARQPAEPMYFYIALRGIYELNSPLGMEEYMDFPDYEENNNNNNNMNDVL